MDFHGFWAFWSYKVEKNVSMSYNAEKNATFVFALAKLEKIPRINRWISLSETYFFIGKKYAKNPKNSFRDFSDIMIGLTSYFQ